MSKIYPQYFYLFVVTVIFLGLFNGGCTNQSTRIVDLEKKLDDLSRRLEGLKPEISELRNKVDKQESGIATAMSAQRYTDSRLKKGLSETGNLIQEIKQDLATVEKDNFNMKAQLEELRVELKKPETLSKSPGPETDITDELSGQAIKSYRQGNFADAISKWGEVLSKSSGKRHAEYNVKVSKDRIKE